MNHHYISTLVRMRSVLKNRKGQLKIATLLNKPKAQQLGDNLLKVILNIFLAFSLLTLIYENVADEHSGSSATNQGRSRSESNCCGNLQRSAPHQYLCKEGSQEFQVCIVFIS